MVDLQNLNATGVKQFGRIDVMVNSAGGETRTSILDSTEEQYDKVLNINFKSAFFGTQLAAQQILSKVAAAASSISLLYMRIGPAGQHGLLSLQKGNAHAHSLGRSRVCPPHNILVVDVIPGAVATQINLSTMNDPLLLKKLDNAIPLGRMADPEEIARVVDFLAGAGASYLTATTIFPNGGLMQSSPGL